MRFVHLTPQPDIACVKKNGIRFGGGRRGRGVYAVPLMLMEQVSCTDDDRILEADARSSTTLWKWLSTLRHRHRNLAAVVFRTTEQHWPADLYFELPAEIGTEWLVKMPAGHVTCTDAHLDYVQEANIQGFSADLKLTIHSENGLGCVLHALQWGGFKTCDRFDESFEIVFPAAIDASLVQWVTPLYRTNQQFKRDRERRFNDG